MSLFANCSQCGKRTVSILLDSLDSNGLCSQCAAKQINVSGLVRQESPDYVPPIAPEGTARIFIDVETTGLDPNKDKIVQLSLVRWINDEAVDGMNTYVDPECPIPFSATQIHGITNEKVADAPKIKDVREQFLSMIHGAVLIGYNIAFDLRFLNNAFDGALVGVEYIDLLPIARNILDLPNYRLETVASHVEFYPEGGYHDALTDCMATSAIYYRLGLQDDPNLSCSFHPSPTSAHKKHGNSVKFSELVPTVSDIDPNGPLYGKTIVFTGELSISRQEAAQLAVNHGAILRTCVSHKTNFLVVGTQDRTVVGSDGMSGKEEQAYALNSAGTAKITILSEDNFFSLLSHPETDSNASLSSPNSGIGRCS